MMLGSYRFSALIRPDRSRWIWVATNSGAATTSRGNFPRTCLSRESVTDLTAAAATCIPSLPAVRGVHPILFRNVCCLTGTRWMFPGLYLDGHGTSGISELIHRPWKVADVCESTEIFILRLLNQLFRTVLRSLGSNSELLALEVGCWWV